MKEVRNMVIKNIRDGEVVEGNIAALKDYIEENMLEHKDIITDTKLGSIDWKTCDDDRCSTRCPFWGYCDKKIEDFYLK